jgi:hypothetical protein
MAYNNFVAGTVATAAAMNSAFGNSGWTTFSTTTSSFSPGTGATQDFRYMQIGKTVFVRGTLTWGTSGYTYGAMDMTLPVSQQSNYAGRYQHVGFANVHRATGPQIWLGAVLMGVITDKIRVVFPNASGTYLYTDDFGGAGVPVTFSSGTMVHINFSYEAA